MDYRFSRAFNAAQRAWDNATPPEYEEDEDDDTGEVEAAEDIHGAFAPQRGRVTIPVESGQDQQDGERNREVG